MEPPPDREQDGAPPSYESIIKNQRDQEIQLNRQPVPENTTSETREPVPENSTSETREPVQELTTSETGEPVQENITSETREPCFESLVFVQIQNEPTSERDTHDMPDIGSDRDLIIPIQ